MLKYQGEIGMHNMVVTVMKNIVLDFLYWPVWWYGPGLIWFAQSRWAYLQYQWTKQGVGIILRNLGTPMFGQTDALSRVISLGLRTWQLGWHNLILLGLGVAQVVLILLWITVMPAVIVFILSV